MGIVWPVSSDLVVTINPLPYTTCRVLHTLLRLDDDGPVVGAEAIGGGPGDFQGAGENRIRGRLGGMNAVMAPSRRS